MATRQQKINRYQTIKNISNFAYYMSLGVICTGVFALFLPEVFISLLLLTANIFTPFAFMLGSLCGLILENSSGLIFTSCVTYFFSSAVFEFYNNREMELLAQINAESRRSPSPPPFSAPPFSAHPQESPTYQHGIQVRSAPQQGTPAVAPVSSFHNTTLLYVPTNYTSRDATHARRSTTLDPAPSRPTSEPTSEPITATQRFAAAYRSQHGSPSSRFSEGMRNQAATHVTRSPRSSSSSTSTSTGSFFSGMGATSTFGAGTSSSGSTSSFFSGMSSYGSDGSSSATSSFFAGMGSNR